MRLHKHFDLKVKIDNTFYSLEKIVPNHFQPLGGNHLNLSLRILSKNPICKHSLLKFLQSPLNVRWNPLNFSALLKFLLCQNEVVGSNLWRAKKGCEPTLCILPEILSVLCLWLWAHDNTKITACIRALSTLYAVTANAGMTRVWKLSVDQLLCIEVLTIANSKHFTSFYLVIADCTESENSWWASFIGESLKRIYICFIGRATRRISFIKPPSKRWLIIQLLINMFLSLS